MSQPLIGAPRDRVEGPDKVTGAAIYTGDYAVPGMLHAVVVPSTIANGRIAAIEDGRARSAPGVVEIMTQRNAPKVNAGKGTENDSLLFLLQNDRVEFDRQPVAVVIADTLEAGHLRSAARKRALRRRAAADEPRNARSATFRKRFSTSPPTACAAIRTEPSKTHR